MKDFLKMTLAVIVGLLIVTVISTFIFFGFISALSAGAESKPSLPKSGILVMDMSKTTITEQASETDIPMFAQGPATKTVSLWSAIQGINAAAEDNTVKYIFLKTDGSMTGAATSEELRKALSNFRSSGKPVVSYIESPTVGTYYLASVADKVYMTRHPGANIMMNGVSGQMIFLKDALDRLGVNVQLIRHGKYKSAGEMFVRSESSPENFQQNKEMVESIWGVFSSGICGSRGITPERLDECIDNLELCLPEDFVKAGLVDSLLDRNGLEQKLADLFVVKKFKDVKMIDFQEYVKAKAVPNFRAKEKIAVIYADGDIIDGEQKKNVAGDRFAKVISEVRADSTVKAVVLRVNSPGGSVLASEKIKAELDLLKEDKPLIASYGGYAASGGYWISNNCNKIFTDANTLTGSIGVFGMIPDFSGTAKNILHVNVTNVNSHRHSDMMTGMRPLDKQEYNYIFRQIEDIYDRFTDIVSQGRGLEKSYVDEIGQGRVWTGVQALANNLVDEIGTLEDAVNYAAICAGGDDSKSFNVVAYPKPLTAMESIMEMLGGSQSVSAAPLGGIRTWYEKFSTGRSDIFFARMPYELAVR